MAVALNNSDTRLTSSGNTVSFSYTSSAGADRLLLVQSEDYGGIAVAAVSYAGTSLSLVGSTGTLNMWQLVAPASGTNTLSFTLASYSHCLPSTSDWTGVDQTTPLGTLVTASGASTTPSSGSAVCPTNGAIYGGMGSAYSTAAPTAGSGTTLAGSVRDGGSGYIKAGGYRSNTGDISFSIPGASTWVAQAAPVNPVSVGVPDIPEDTLHRPAMIALLAH